MPVASGNIHLFGVRHHGPGSARSLLHALEVAKPQCVLIEGPPEANDILPLASHEELRPPVAVLIYPPEGTRGAVLYPFAKFSPEWQAIRFALARQVPVRFIDLPASQRGQEAPEGLSADPLAGMAAAAGYSDTERWWDHLVESRSGKDVDVFAALHEMMTAIRAELDPQAGLLERQREAHMRRCIRAAIAEGFDSIAVVCGAYHTPALATRPPARDDDALLKGLPRSRMEAAWVPWSYERLSIDSGYGAGIESPVWYELLWERRPLEGAGAGADPALGAAWITRAARLLREADVPTSSAHVIETCRLADTLSALRGRPIPGLPEYQDAAVAVLGSGDAVNLRMISHAWHFDSRLGNVPEAFPAAPLQRDLAALQKRLRLPPRLEETPLELDLRKPIDRERGLMLRRLRILGVNWGTPPSVQRQGKGTFAEIWTLAWKPELLVTLIGASRHGHTLEQAAASLLAEKAAGATQLKALVDLLGDALLADLPDAVAALVAAIENEAAGSTDVPQLLEVIPPLVGVYRYGDVRATDVSLVAHILAGVVPRMLIGLPGACASIDDEAARALWKRVRDTAQHLSILGDAGYLNAWHETLSRLAASPSTHPLLAGGAQRLLYDAHAIEREELARALSLALSGGAEPQAAAGWVEGLLSGSGMILIHNDQLRQVLDDWVRRITAPHFLQLLPLLRRTFAQFDTAERRVIGERVAAHGQRQASGSPAPDAEIDTKAAGAVIPVLALIWGQEKET
jgi:hypothetical protein